MIDIIIGCSDAKRQHGLCEPTTYGHFMCFIQNCDMFRIVICAVFAYVTYCVFYYHSNRCCRVHYVFAWVFVVFIIFIILQNMYGNCCNIKYILFCKNNWITIWWQLRFYRTAESIWIYSFGRCDLRCRFEYDITHA